jgi:hypothetical protein
MSFFYGVVNMNYHYYFNLKGDYQCRLFTRPSTYAIITILFERVITNVVFLLPLPAALAELTSSSPS